MLKLNAECAGELGLKEDFGLSAVQLDRQKAGLVDMIYGRV